MTSKLGCEDGWESSTPDFRAVYWSLQPVTVLQVMSTNSFPPKFHKAVGDVNLRNKVFQIMDGKKNPGH